MTGLPLPGAIQEVQERYPWPRVAERARGYLAKRLPALTDRVSDYPDAAFGLSSGFFYLPSAQAYAWGVRSPNFHDSLLLTLALGHFHFAWHDMVVDEGKSDPYMCLLSDAALLGYLDELEHLGAGTSRRSYRGLHDDYYRRYSAAIVADLKHRDRLNAYTPEEVIALGDKASPGFTVFHLIADLAGRPEVSGLTRAMTLLCTGLQLVDDQADAPTDAKDGNMTWPLTEASRSYPELLLSDRDSVVAAVIGSGAAAACLRLAEKAFLDAEVLAGTADATVVAELARTWLGRSRLMASNLDSFTSNLTAVRHEA